jgi:hypothetical protein
MHIMTVALSLFAGAGWQFLDNNGNPLSGGLVHVYLAGTTTPTPTYTSSTGSTQNTNPIVLDSAGRPPEQIWTDPLLNYKFTVSTSASVLIRTYDNIRSPFDLENLVFVQAGTGAVEQNAQDKMRQLFTVLDFGAVGNNSTDDTVNIQKAIDACPTGGTLIFNAGYTFYCGSRLVINKAMTISAYGATVRFNGTRSGGQNNDAISITASNVKILGGTWKEVAPTTNSGDYGITFYGVENDSVTPPTYIENVGIQDATIVDWQGESVIFRMCQNFYVTNCDISNIGYAGVQALSSNQGVISNNRIGDIHPTGVVGSFDNAYGIAITCNSNGNTVGRPLSHDVTVTGNYVYNVKTWEGIDTHGGYNISVVGNTVRNCRAGIALVSYVGGATTAQDAGARRCAVTGNTIENDPLIYPSRDGMSYGIVADGDVGVGGDTGDGVVISGNTLTYCGGKNSTESLGAIEGILINALVVSGNSISESGSNAIMLFSCANSLVDSNSIWEIEPFNAASFPAATATFSGNPTAADTITLNGVVCTFVATPSAINSNTAINVLIGASQADTITNLQNILVTARDTGTASVMPNGLLQFTSFSNDGTAFVVTYRYPTRMLSTSWTVSESSSVISWSGANLSIPSDDRGAGIRTETLSGSAVAPTGQISNNFIRNPSASGIAIRGICAVSDTEISYRGNALSGVGVLYDLEGSAVLTCGSVSNLFENSVTYDLPSIAAGATYEFYIPQPTAIAIGASVSVFPSRYLNGLIMSVQPQSDASIVQLYNPTAGAINLASTRFTYKYEQLRNDGNYGELN